MLEVRATRQAYDDDVINDLGWIRREYNADSLTKIEVNQAMMKFMMTGVIDFVVEQFVIKTRTTARDNSSE